LVGTDNAWAVFEIWGWALTIRVLNFFPAWLHAYTNTEGTDKAIVEWTTSSTPKPYYRYGLANERGDVLTVTLWGERLQQIHLEAWCVAIHYPGTG